MRRAPVDRWSKGVLALWLVLAPFIAHAAPLVVLDARGGTFKVGQRIDGARPLTLKEGERVTLIAVDGRSVTLRGPFGGLPLGRAAPAVAPRQALSALITSRTARANSVGVVRGGETSAVLPDPWLVDVSGAGDRCFLQGSRPMWWRPDASTAQPFTVAPIDRSWRADFRWKAGQDRMSAPELGPPAAQTTILVRYGEQEFVVRLNQVPRDLDNDLMLASWLLEKNCLQQADALLRTLDVYNGAALPTPGTRSR